MDGRAEQRGVASLVMAAMMLAAMTGAGAAQTTERVFARGLDTSDPNEFKDVPLSQLTRAYIPEAIDLSSRFPEPGRQHKVGSCVSWAVGYGARSYYELTRAGASNDDKTRIASPAHLHALLVSQFGGTCKDPNTNIEKALFVLQTRGVSPISETPSEPAEVFCLARPSSDNRFRVHGVVRVAEKVNNHRTGKFVSGLSRSSLDRIRLMLAQGHPVLVGMLVGITFQKLNAGETYRSSIHQAVNLKEEDPGGHAMVIVGYDDRRHAFRLLNSWGSDWADGGFGWVDYDTLIADGMSAVAMKTDTDPPRPVPSQPPSQVGNLAAELNFSCASFFDNKTRVSGFVSSEADLRRIRQMADGKPNSIELRPWPICEALLTLREPLQRPGRPKVELVGGDRPLKVGEAFAFSVKPADVPAYLYVFYIEDDGTVVNLSPRRGPLRKQTDPAGPPLLFGDGKDGRPTFRVTPLKSTDAEGKPRQAGDPERGHEAVVAIAARAPIEELEAQETPDSPIYRVAAKAQASDGPPDRLFLSLLRDIVLKRAAPDTLPREVMADILHVKIVD